MSGDDKNLTGRLPDRAHSFGFSNNYGFLLWLFMIVFYDGFKPDETIYAGLQVIFV